jgi:hypothetical protein
MAMKKTDKDIHPRPEGPLPNPGLPTDEGVK